jgi:urea transporter
MPEAKKWVKRQNLFIRIADAILRGIGEVAFLNNSISGLVIITGIFLNSWEFGVAMLIGSAVSLLTAKFFKLNDNLISNGIYGYNAVAL